MIKVAYDLDGVLIPDCDRIPKLGELAAFYDLTLYMRPIFVPQGAYAIITARPEQYATVTAKWCEKYLTSYPAKIYHGIKNQSPAEYKTTILNINPNIRTYIESDLNIVKELQKNVNTGCNIIHFSDYLEHLW